MKNKILALIILAFTILPTLVSCSNDGSSGTNSDNASDTTSAESTTATESIAPGDDLPDYDANGQAFNVYARRSEPYGGEFNATEETGDTINDAIYRRNLVTEERLDVDIVYIDAGDDYPAFYDNLLNVILSGEDAYHLIAGKTYHIANHVLDGNYIDWYTIPHINFDNPWWSAGFTEAASILGHSFLATGDLSPSFLQYSFAIFYNKSIADDLGVEGLYDTVRAGEWTFDKLAEYSAIATADINGDGVMDTKDRYGMVTEAYTSLDTYLYAFEIPLSSRDSEGNLSIVGVTERYQSALEKLNTYFWSDGYGYIDLSYKDNASFSKGLALFTPSNLYDASVLRAMEDDFGIIPFPKYDTAQEEYHTYYNDNATSFSVPITVKDLEFVGIVTEFMAAKSYEQVRPAIYEVALKTKYSRDEDSREMIELILDSMIFDFTNIYAYAFGDQNSPAHSLRRNLHMKSNDITSYFAERETVYAETLDKLVSVVAGK